MDEFGLIDAIVGAARDAGARTEADADGILLGPGDDCALLAPAPGCVLAVSTDTCVADVHFPARAPADHIAGRALAVALSDLAAMGARADGVVVSLTVPDADAGWCTAFGRGLGIVLADCGAALLGGDLTRGPLALAITVLGSVDAKRALTRGRLAPDDVLLVSGALGGAAAALILGLHEREPVTEDERALRARYWSPQPRLRLGAALVAHARVAIDVSDGLLADAAHLATASGLTLAIDSAAVPVDAAAQRLLGPAQALQCALQGGDDYELLCAAAPADVGALQSAAAAAGAVLTPIGRAGAAAAPESVVVHLDGVPVDAATLGYRHFGAPA